MTSLSIVTTLYKSSRYIEEFYKRVSLTARKIASSYEIVFVNDGSPDDSASRVLKLRETDERVKLLDLSRNFGHHRAIMSGLSVAKGDHIFLIDVDLEEDPELLADYWDTMNARGCDVVYGVQEKRKGNFLERASGSVFYGVMNSILSVNYPANTLTARLMNRDYVDAVLQFREKDLDIWTVFMLAGFDQQPRISRKGYKGDTVYTLRKKARMALTIIVSTTSIPIFYIGLLGLILTFGVFLVAVYLFVAKLVYGNVIEGWTSIMLSIWFFSGMLLMSIGLVGIYLSTVFNEVKNRPIVIIRKYHV